jgi:hypothetical protein
MAKSCLKVIKARSFRLMSLYHLKPCMYRSQTAWSWWVSLAEHSRSNFALFVSLLCAGFSLSRRCHDGRQCVVQAFSTGFHDGACHWCRVTKEGFHLLGEVNTLVSHPVFKAKTRGSSYVCPGSSCHTYGQNVSTEYQCLYYIVSYYKNLLHVQKGLNSGMDPILPQAVDRGFRTPRRNLHPHTPHLLSSRT